MISGLVSIIVPVYNARTYLSDCIGSVLAQTWPDWELLIVDDGSTDGGGFLCDSYAKRDKRIRVMHTTNGGPAAARNAGIGQARGEFIFFLDADDSLVPDAIESLLKSQHGTGADMVIGDFVQVRNGAAEEKTDASLPQKSLLLRRPDLVSLTRYWLRRPNLLFAFVWGRLLKASIIREHCVRFNEQQRTFEDVFFNYTYLLHADTVFFLKRDLCRHRVYEHFSCASITIANGPEGLWGFSHALPVVAECLQRYGLEQRAIDCEIGHARVNLSIIFLVRMCAQYSLKTKQAIEKFVQRTVNDDKVLRRSLRFYTPSKGQSRLLPLLIKAKLAQPIIWLCRRKAQARYPQRAAIRTVDLIITEKCSMRCQDCANLMQYYEHPIDESSAALFDMVDAFLRNVEEIGEVRVIGGEPLMNRDCHRIVEKLTGQEKVRKVVIYSNGTIPLRDEQIDSMRNEKVLFAITDYGSLSRNLGRLTGQLDRYGIAYIARPAEGWTDCSSIEKHNRTPQQQMEVFENCCARSLFTLSAGRLYRCPFAANAARLQAIPDLPGDYVVVTTDSRADIERLAVDAKYLEACDYCTGRNPKDPTIVPAIQSAVVRRLMPLG
jgi:glycosyltransferase involved in cell wall biosynthesis